MATQPAREKPPALLPERNIRGARGIPPAAGPLRGAIQARRPRQPLNRQYLRAAAVRLFRRKRNRRRTNMVPRHPSGERHTSGRFESLVRFAPRRVPVRNAAIISRENSQRATQQNLFATLATFQTTWRFEPAGSPAKKAVRARIAANAWSSAIARAKGAC